MDFNLINMNCKNCKYFKKLRNLSFGECLNDKMFQYAENKNDLEGLINSALVIVGDGQPVVGINYMCGHYISRKDKKGQPLSSAHDNPFSKGFSPPAKKKRESSLRYSDAKFKEYIPTPGIKLDSSFEEPYPPKYIEQLKHE